MKSGDSDEMNLSAVIIAFGVPLMSFVILCFVIKGGLKPQISKEDNKTSTKGKSKKEKLT